MYSSKQSGVTAVAMMIQTVLSLTLSSFSDVVQNTLSDKHRQTMAIIYG